MYTEKSARIAVEVGIPGAVKIKVDAHKEGGQVETGAFDCFYSIKHNEDVQDFKVLLRPGSPLIPLLLDGASAELTLE